MKNVAILNNKTNEVIGTYGIDMEGLNYTPSQEDYFTQAWENAVDDQIVVISDRDNYSFSFVK